MDPWGTPGLQGGSARSQIYRPRAADPVWVTPPPFSSAGGGVPPSRTFSAASQVLHGPNIVADFQEMRAFRVAARIHREAAGREDILPTPLLRASRVFSGQRFRQEPLPCAIRRILFMPRPDSGTAAHRALRLLFSRAIVFGLQIMNTSPVADAHPRFQAIFVCRSEVNAPVQPAHCRFLRCSETSWKAAVHAGQKI